MTTETRDRILDAGIACFAARGFKGATTRTLAAAAGVNIATLAYHFGDKQGLYRAAIDRLYERLLDLQPEPGLLSGGTPRERVAKVASFALRFCREHQTEVRLLHFLEEGQLPAPIRERWVDELLEQAEVIRSFLGLAADPKFRLKLLTLNHLVVRFAITPPEELIPFVSDSDPEAAEAEVEALFVELAQDLLAGSNQTGSTQSGSDQPE